jgi:sugar O-acyltransferase (sialic acid O-acetyltransferase NeuD family)
MPVRWQMSRVVVFGTGPIAELAHFYLTHDSPHDVVGFTVDEDYMREPTFRELPVVPFETLEDTHAAGDVSLFLPISFKQMNHVRADRVATAKAKGYELISYVSTYATTFPGFACGENCFILEDNTIQPFVQVGSDVILWSGNHIGHHSIIEDHVMVTSQVVISGGCTIEPHCFLGVNATIRDETVIGRETLVGAGVTILHDTEPYSVYKAKDAEPAGFRSDQIRAISHKSGG